MPGSAGSLTAARRFQERGLRELFHGHPKEAERLLAKGLSGLAGDDTVESTQVRAHLMITLAYAEFELAGLEPALRRLDEAADLLRARGVSQLTTLLHSQRGMILLRVGRLDEALGEFDAGVRTWADAPRGDRCRVLQNRAVVHMELHAVPAARADLERCLDEAAQSPDLLVQRVHATHNLGFVEFMAGNLPAALHLMDEAFALGPELAPGTALLGKAQVLVEAGLLREADDALVAAGALFRKGRLHRDLAETELERARCALAEGEARQALRLATAARERFRRTGSDRWRRGAELVALQASLAAGRRPSGIVEAAQRLHAELAGDRLRLPARAASLITAEALLAARQVAAAESMLDDVGRPRPDDPITGRMHSHYVQARVDAELGRRPAALRRIRRALDELTQYQASFGSLDLRTASAVHGRRLAELDVRLALESGRAASVFAAAERARAVSSRLSSVRPPADPVAAELLAQLRQLLDTLRSVEQDKRAADPLLRQRRELERQIVARTWTRSGSATVARPISLDDVRAELARQQRTMVTYVQAGGSLSAVTVGPRVRVYDLGPSAPILEQVRRTRADLDVAANPRLPAPIRTAVRASLQRSLNALDDALLARLGVDGALVLVSTGVLGQVAWGSLPSLRGRPVVVAPSATKWFSSAAFARSTPLTVAAMAGPGLDRGGAEVQAVGTTWPDAVVTTGAEATTDALVAALASSTVLHVAAHGVHQPENPLFSSIRMADGPVFAHELDQHAQAPPHVLLSACEVGLATIRPGDEALGLASVLLALGTRSVIAGLARVGDEIAAHTMATYHAKLAAGADSAAALADALAEGDRDIAPPFVNFGAAWSPGVQAPAVEAPYGQAPDLEPGSRLA